MEKKIRCPICNTDNEKFISTCNKCGFTLSPSVIPGALKTLAPGTVLDGRYEIVNKIKSGGMGSVYKAKHVRLAKTYAVKELINLSMTGADQEEAIKRFNREAEILSSISHQSMPAVIDYFSINKRYYLVMDFIDGKDLNSILSEYGSPGLPEKEVVEWAGQICDILHYLHNRRPPVIYRDIKPSNIMIRRSDNKAVLIDFGVARTVQTEAEISQTKTSIGTIAYMSPEQYRGKPKPGSDIYSLGATMHHLISGKHPIPFAFFSLKKDCPGISRETDAIILKAVQISEEDRFKSAEEMKKALLGMIAVDIPEENDLQQEEPDEEKAEPDVNMRKEFVETLGEIKTEDGKLSLLKIAQEDKIPEVRKNALENLSKFPLDKDIEKNLKEILINDKSPPVRTAVLKSIGEYNSRAFSADVIHALEDEDEDVLIEAIITIRKLKEEKALKKLQDIIEREDGIVKEEAFYAIEHINPEEVKELKEKENIKKEQAENKKKLSFIIFTSLIIIATLFISRYILHLYNLQKLDKHLKEGFLCIETFELEKGREIFQKAYDISKKMSDHSKEGTALYGLGLSYYMEGDSEKAAEYFEKAVKCNEYQGEPYLYLGNIYIREGEGKKAINYLEKARKLMPGEESIYISLIELYYNSGQREKAGLIIKEAREVVPKIERNNNFRELVKIIEGKS